MSLRSKLQSALRRADSMLEPTERDAEIAKAKADAAAVLKAAREQATGIIDETKRRYDAQSPAVKARLAHRLRKLADKIE